MSRRIKKIQLHRNMVFEAAVSGGYGDQRTAFNAGTDCRLTLDAEVGGVLVDKPGQAFTVPLTSIDYIEWERETLKAKPKDAA